MPSFVVWKLSLFSLPVNFRASFSHQVLHECRAAGYYDRQAIQILDFRVAVLGNFAGYNFFGFESASEREIIISDISGLLPFVIPDWRKRPTTIFPYGHDLQEQKSIAFSKSGNKCKEAHLLLRDAVGFLPFMPGHEWKRPSLFLRSATVISLYQGCCRRWIRPSGRSAPRRWRWFGRRPINPILLGNPWPSSCHEQHQGNRRTRSRPW